MLKIAEDRVPAFALVEPAHVVNIDFEMYDIFDDEDAGPAAAHTIISSLVIEHLPLELYFRRAASLLEAQGLLMVTNMHPDMGNTNFQHSTDSGGGEINP